MAKNEYPCTDVQPVLIYGHDGTLIQRIKVDAAGRAITIEHLTLNVTMIGG